MLLLLFALIGVAAVVFSAVSLAGGLRGTVTPEVGVVTSAAAAGAWALWAMHASEVAVADGSGGLITQSYPSLRAVAIVGFAVMLVTLIRATMATLNTDDLTEITQS